MAVVFLCSCRCPDGCPARLPRPQVRRQLHLGQACPDSVHARYPQLHRVRLSSIPLAMRTNAAWANHSAEPCLHFCSAYFTVDMTIGAVILGIWQYFAPADALASAPLVASALIAGDGVWSVPSAILALAKVNPPMCAQVIPPSRHSNNAHTSHHACNHDRMTYTLPCCAVLLDQLLRGERVSAGTVRRPMAAFDWTLPLRRMTAQPSPGCSTSEGHFWALYRGLVFYWQQQPRFWTQEVKSARLPSLCSVEFSLRSA